MAEEQQQQQQLAVAQEEKVLGDIFTFPDLAHDFAEFVMRIGLEGTLQMFHLIVDNFKPHIDARSEDILTRLEAEFPEAPCHSLQIIYDSLKQRGQLGSFWDFVDSCVNASYMIRNIPPEKYRMYMAQANILFSLANSVRRGAATPSQVQAQLTPLFLSLMQGAGAR